MPDMIFAHRLKGLRTGWGWSQVDLATQAGLKQQEISNYERGVQRPGVLRLKKLAAVFGVTVDSLVEGW
jgi:transcriptional regulator with XRE-family HTH domain